MSKHGVGGGARHLPRWTLLGSGKEEVVVTDYKRRRHCHGGGQWVGSPTAAGATVPSNGDAYKDEGGGLCDLKADGAPPPPLWLVCGFCLRERMNEKYK